MRMGVVHSNVACVAKLSRGRRRVTAQSGLGKLSGQAAPSTKRVHIVCEGGSGGETDLPDIPNQATSCSGRDDDAIKCHRPLHLIRPKGGVAKHTPLEPMAAALVPTSQCSS
jgi:hypothetical protein